MALWCVCRSIFPDTFFFFFSFPFWIFSIHFHEYIDGYWSAYLNKYLAHMHLVRIHVKPRPQHGPHQPADPTDPTAVNIRRGYELPTRTERVARWSSSIWHYLPFVSQVSPSQNKTRFSFDRNDYCNKNLLNVCQLPMQLIPTEIDIRSPRILIEFDLHNNVYVKCIDIGYILRLFYRVFRKEIFFFSSPLDWW